MSRNCKDAATRREGYCLTVGLSRYSNAMRIVVDLLDFGIHEQRHSGSNCFRNSIHSVGEVPESASESVPNRLHQNRARGVSERAANCSTETRLEDFFKEFFASLAESRKVLPNTLRIEPTAAVTASMN